MDTGARTKRSMDTGARTKRSTVANTQEGGEQATKYQRYVREGKHEAKNGNLSRSLNLLQKAYCIYPSEKLEGRIGKLEEALKQLDLQEEQDDEFVEVLNSGLMVFKDLYNKLFEHQKEGVSFLYSLYRDGLKGGILADDMGLGKTIQVIAFLSGMFDAELIKCALLIMPTTLISNWLKEFDKWTPGMRVDVFHGTNKKQRGRKLEEIQRKGGILITTYQMIVHNWQQVSTYNGMEFVWEYIVLDEAHKIKTSSTKSAKSCYAIPAKNRVLLTGTPVQNNLREMWSLYDFACQGTLLGTSKTFKTEYENPITRAREKDSTPGEKALGLKVSENLMKVIKPHFLRRTKSDVQTEQRVQKAHELVQMESQVNEQLMEQLKGSEGACLRQMDVPETTKPTRVITPTQVNSRPVTIDRTEEDIGNVSCQMTSMKLDSSGEDEDEKLYLAPFINQTPTISVADSQDILASSLASQNMPSLCDSMTDVQSPIKDKNTEPVYSAAEGDITNRERPHNLVLTTSSQLEGPSMDTLFVPWSSRGRHSSTASIRGFIEAAVEEIADISETIEDTADESEQYESADDVFIQLEEPEGENIVHSEEYKCDSSNDEWQDATRGET